MTQSPDPWWLPTQRPAQGRGVPVFLLYWDGWSWPEKPCISHGKESQGLGLPAGSPLSLLTPFGLGSMCLSPSGFCSQTQILLGSHEPRLKRALSSGSSFLLLNLIKHFLLRHRRMTVQWASFGDVFGRIIFFLTKGLGRLSSERAGDVAQSVSSPPEHTVPSHPLPQTTQFLTLKEGAWWREWILSCFMGSEYSVRLWENSSKEQPKTIIIIFSQNVPCSADCKKHWVT